MVKGSLTLQKHQLLYDIRHTYRAFLRAASYLPDANARTYIHDYIVHRFNPFNPLKLDPAKWGTDEFRNKIPVERTEERLKKAQKALRSLQRASDGNPTDLKKVLMHAYGRAGKRRRELISDLLRPGEEEAPEDDSALQHLIQDQITNKWNHPGDNTSSGNRNAKPVPYTSEKFETFLKSQKQAVMELSSGKKKLRTIRPKIPPKNIWGRSMPLKRQKNMRKKWLLNTMSMVLPPLPAHEWNRLREITSGVVSVNFPPRRKRLGLAMESDDKFDSLIRHFITPARANTSTALEPKQDGTLCVKKQETKDGPRVEYKRSMRRIYGTIWNLSSLMTQNADSKQWNITWGEHKSRVASGHLTEPSARDMELFEQEEGTKVFNAGPTHRLKNKAKGKKGSASTRNSNASLSRSRKC